MAEYNMTYSDLKKRLLTLKILINTDITLKNPEKNSFLISIDNILKNLDERYSERKHLSIIEVQTEEIESFIKK